MASDEAGAGYEAHGGTRSPSTDGAPSSEPHVKDELVELIGAAGGHESLLSEAAESVGPPPLVAAGQAGGHDTVDPADEAVDVAADPSLDALLPPAPDPAAARDEALGAGTLDASMLPLDNLGDLDPANLPDPLSLFDLDAANGTENTEEAERERMKLLISYFDEQQMARYLAFRRANIRRAAVRKYASHLLNQPISNNVAMVLAGMSKVLIGDIIELAREVQDKKEGRAERTKPLEGKEPEPLLPSSIREAWRICKQNGAGVPGSKLRPGSGNRLF